MNQPDPPLRARRKRPATLSKTLEKIARQKSKVHPSLALACDDGAMPPKIARVSGPYRCRDKWRVVVFENEGRKSMVANSIEEAEKIKADLLRLFEDRSLLTIGAALDEWLEDKRQAGLKSLSVETVDKRLRPFLPLDSTLGEVTPQRAAKLYLDETRRQSRNGGVLRACTHHKTLSFTKGFFSWAVERGYIKENPFTKVKPIGKANAGKTQLREDEARKLYELALVMAQDGDWRALALLVQLVMGLRSSEVLGLRARDLDANGSVLVIEGTKTKNARRRLKIASEPVRRLLMARCAGLAPDALIFATARGGRMLTPTLYKAMHRLCYLAEIPKVCPHSLRGLHSSLAVAHGESSRAVAQALGHGSDAITRKHYIAPEALDNARLDRVTSTLSGTGIADLEGLSSALSGLSPEQLSTLLASVEKRRKTV